ncbi:MAG: DnaJ C-terminal domain-containing protein [Rhizomicrobium sp.]|nr:DnaJ C-terminal domain-containing protein [Rhizomicrobium sp.]
MPDLDDPYKTLGVKRDASQDAIRKAFRKLAKKHHPDLNPGNAKAEELFKNASNANELLSDPEKRGQFDRGEIDAVGHERQPTYREQADGEAGRRYSRASGQPSEWSDDALSDLFGSMFNDVRRPAEARRAPGHDERFSLTAEFLHAVTGATNRLTLPDGRVLDVKIPAGTLEGQVLRLQGQGGAGYSGGPSGDALIEIHIAPHAFYTRSGQDIRLDLPVSLAEAVLGGEILVPTPTGPVRMKIAPGSDSGTELRLRGRGVPAHGPQLAGQLYVKLRVVIGAPDTALEEFLRSWKPEHPSNPRQAMEKK